jgi:hypothetical protein
MEDGGRHPGAFDFEAEFWESTKRNVDLLKNMVIIVNSEIKSSNASASSHCHHAFGLVGVGWDFIAPRGRGAIAFDHGVACAGAFEQLGLADDKGIATVGGGLADVGGAGGGVDD